MIFRSNLLFRFTLIFFGLLIFPFPLSIVPLFDFVTTGITNLYHAIIPWFARTFLHLGQGITIFSNGSGDTTYDYVLLLFYFIMAILGTIAWSIIDKKKREYEKVRYIFEITLRFYLAYIMISYGLFKIIPLQFPEPYFYKLLQPLGNFSPMGLFWSLMGASTGYSIFSGSMEFIGGIFLLFKRTKLLGILLLIPVLINIVAVNFFYDVPVKLFSSLLLVISIILIFPYLSRLLKVVLTNEQVPVYNLKEFYNRGRWKIIRPIFKWIFVAGILYFNISAVFESNNTYGPNSPKPPLYGLYEVSHFTINHDTLPEILSDTIRWRYITVEFQGSLQLHRTNMSRTGFQMELDSTENKIKLTSQKDSTDISNLYYTKTDSILTIQGLFRNDSIYCQAKTLHKENFLLLNRGFHWINEYPFNR